MKPFLIAVQNYLSDGNHTNYFLTIVWYFTFPPEGKNDGVLGKVEGSFVVDIFVIFCFRQKVADKKNFNQIKAS
jgi:hypothetical protein